MERPWDIIDEIGSSVGKIRSARHAGAGSEGYYGDAYREAIRGPGKDLFSKHGQSPDEALDLLRRNGLIGQDATVDDLWDVIIRAGAARRALAGGDHPERQASRFTAALVKQSGRRCTRKVAVNAMAVGEKFRFAKEPFTVEDIDPDTLEVTVADGRRFGKQRIPDGAVIDLDAPCEAKPAKKIRSRRVPRRRPSAKPIQKPAAKRIRQRRRPRAMRSGYVAVRAGTKIRLWRVINSRLKSLGLFSFQALKRWAKRNGIRF